ncbi:pyridoxine 5'-phosphate synthase [Thermodesulfobacterium hydrogeniphilum]|uniref:pyridoxine 5'-phosphate synthase n=1 Tax=Thermodesulfobacterium hydrogeniphilum TaxID=161156 RepID=UPI0009FD9E35|nr:pyridoxine 5'-phosphate synthase [Thermodesulfobacterium hydrogeniphilum]
MPVDIYLTTEDLISEDLLKDLEKKIKKALRILKLPKKEISLTFVDNKHIWKLNKQYLGRDYPTNVLSFPFAKERILVSDLLGEIIISVEKAKEEAEFYGLNFENYLLALIIHGLLHLLDYDHEKGVYSPWLMLKNELNLLNKLGFKEGKKEIINFTKRREYMPAKLAVNVDHVATVREARKVPYPDPVHAAVLAELGGADGIVVHLRLDRRHIKERDVRIIKDIIKTKLILEMAIDEELIKFAKEIKPYQVTLVPERVEEITTEGGMILEGRVDEVKKAVKELNKAGIKVSLFINPDEKTVKLAKKTGAQIVEIHTGIYADAETEEEREKEFSKIEISARLAKDSGLIVHAGHGLSYENIGPVAAIPEIEEFSIGHSIVSRAIMVGMEKAVREMKELILRARG